MRGSYKLYKITKNYKVAFEHKGSKLGLWIVFFVGGRRFWGKAGRENRELERGRRTGGRVWVIFGAAQNFGGRALCGCHS